MTLPELLIRSLTATDAPVYFAFRLAGLAESPLAFGRSAEEYRHEPLETVAAGLAEHLGERVTLGAFLSGELVGAMTAVRELTLKRRHKGNIYAVYVSPAARGQRVGETLLSALLAWAGAVPGLEQLHLAVSVTQEPARRLYLRHGFQVYGLEPKALRVNGRDIDDELMVRFLDG
ncbi:N-acetyltransferase family protein [Deinococcus sp.]|uniref:GNAT family N-acetyltransferase n=1 Tax=Deinococcus sp. TaxID=47478 RepID=UPI003C7DB4CD